MSFFTPSNLRTVTGGRWLNLVDRDQELTGVGIDTREDLDGRAFIAIKGENFDGHDYLAHAVKSGAELLVVEREMTPDELPDQVSVMLVDDSVRAMMRLARAYRRTLTGTKVIGITGSAGKTTTKRLIDGVLAQAMTGRAAPKSFNNQIGVSLTILGADAADKYLVVEIGTNAPGEIASLAAITEPDLAVITMIGRGHLAGFGSIEDIAQEKAALLQAVRPGGLVVVHADSPLLAPFIKSVEKCITFGESPEADLRLTDRGHGPNGAWFEMNSRHRFELGLPGRHNAVNALAAIAVGRRFGLDDEAIRRGLGSVEPESMRLQRQNVRGIDLHNDAYNANPESVKAALETFAELTTDAKRRVLVLGDMLELGDEAEALHREIGRAILELEPRCPIDRVYTVGDLAGFIARTLGESWTGDRAIGVRSVEALVKQGGLDDLKKGDALLLKGSRGMALERLVESLESRRRPGRTAAKKPPSTKKRKVKA